MIRITDLPRAIQTSINGWRLWVTLALLVSLIINEAVIGLRNGETVTESLTRLSYWRLLYLAFICGVIAQASIGAVPFAIGVTMTLYDTVIKRRQGWKLEGRAEGRVEGREEGRVEGRAEGKEEGRAEERREKIAAVLAHPELTPEQKVLVVEILNADHQNPPGGSDPA